MNKTNNLQFYLCIKELLIVENLPNYRVYLFTVDKLEATEGDWDTEKIYF